MHVELSGLRVLILDDSAHMLALLGTILLSFGIRDVTRVRSAHAAVKALDGGRVDIAIVDKHLEGDDGLQLLRTVRRREEGRDPRIPIILLTAHTAKSVVIDAVMSGATDVLSKPVSARVLYEHIVDAVLKPRPLFDCGGYLVPIPRGVPTEQVCRMSAESFLGLVRTTAEQRAFRPMPGSFLDDDLVVSAVG